MTVTPGSLRVGDTGKLLDTTVVETTEGDVHREVVVVADPADPDARGNVVPSHADRSYYAWKRWKNNTAAILLLM